MVGKIFANYVAGISLDSNKIKEDILTINWDDELTEDKIKKMLDHYAVNLGLNLIKISIIGKGGTYVNRKSEKLTNFINQKLEEMDESFDDYLFKMLSFLEYGWFVAEKIWKIENGNVVLKGFIDLEQENTYIYMGLVDGMPKITKFQNYSAEIPAEKCLYIANEPRNKNPYGRSILRSVYKHYIASDRFQRYEALFLERMGIPPIIMKILGYNEANLELAQTIIQMLHEESGVAIPNSWDMKTLETEKKGDSYFRPAIQYHDIAILRGLLFPAGLVDEGKSGTYGLGDIRFEIFKWTINNYRKRLKFVLDRLFKEWVSYISPKLANCGEWKWTPYQNIDWIQVTEGIKNLVDAQIFDPTIDTDYIRTEILGLKTLKDVDMENKNENRVDFIKNRKYVPSTVYRTDALMKAKAYKKEIDLKEKEAKNAIEQTKAKRNNEKN